MMRRRLLFGLVVASVLAGCGLKRPAIDIQTYLVMPGEAKGIKTAAPLRLSAAPFDIASPYDGKPIVYRFGEARFETDFYNQYLVAPRLMLMQQTVEWLRRAGHDATTGSRRDAYTLHAKVAHMYGDFRDAQNPRAVLDISFVVRAADGDRIVLERDYAAAVPIPDRSADSVARGLGTALQQTLTQLNADFRALKEPLLYHRDTETQRKP